MSSNAGDIMRYLQGEDMPDSNSVTGRWPPGYVSLQEVQNISDPPFNDEDSQILDFVNYEALELPAESEYQSTSDESVEATPEPTAASPVRKDPFWDVPKTWTVDEANLRAFEVFQNSTWTPSESDLPPEAGLMYMPKRPEYPVLRDEDGDEVQSKRFPKVVLRDIPWLPEVFELQTPAWMVNLYMIFGATVRDMATRVHPDDEPRKTQQQLENRILKKSLDYRNRYGGFGHDIRPVKGNRVTENAKYLLLGNKAGRQPLSAYQLIYSRELLGTVYPGSRKMSQSPNSTRYPLPKPQEVCTQIQGLLGKLGVKVPTMAQCGLFVDEDGNLLGEDEDEEAYELQAQNAVDTDHEVSDHSATLADSSDSNDELDLSGYTGYYKIGDVLETGHELPVSDFEDASSDGGLRLNTEFETAADYFNDAIDESTQIEEKPMYDYTQVMDMPEYGNSESNVLATTSQYSTGNDVLPVHFEDGTGNNVLPVHSQNGNGIHGLPVQFQDGIGNNVRPTNFQNGNENNMFPVNFQNGIENNVLPLHFQDGKGNNMPPVNFQNVVGNDVLPLHFQNSNGNYMFPVNLQNGVGNDVLPINFQNGNGNYMFPVNLQNGGGNAVLPVNFQNGNGNNMLPVNFQNGTGNNVLPLNFQGITGNNFQPTNFQGENGNHVLPTNLHHSTGNESLSSSFQNSTENKHQKSNNVVSTGSSQTSSNISAPNSSLSFEVAMGFKKESKAAPRKILDPVLQEIWDDIMNPDAMDMS